MRDCRKFYIDGRWVSAAGQRRLPIVNPATEDMIGEVAVAEAADVDQAVRAARGAFERNKLSVDKRLELLRAIGAAYEKRVEELAQAITLEMGCPIGVSRSIQAVSGLGHLAAAIEALTNYHFSEGLRAAEIVAEPIGVAALITPWNWPMNQVAVKVLPALAAGCAVVLKPSEISPISADIFAEILHEAGVPAGLFNLVHGDGATTGAALSAHPDVDMVSFTGSTRTGIAITRAAAATIKRVTLELGGKSPNVLLDDADFQTAVPLGVQATLLNSGQTCSAPTRMLVPRARQEEAIEIAKATARAFVPGDPTDPATLLGPVASAAQYRKVTELIGTGIAEGARLVTGGVPAEKRSRGFFVEPTIFADVRNDMTIAQEEIFGPVLVIEPYDTEEDAIKIANDTRYGLAAYVVSTDETRARRVASRLRAGSVWINGAAPELGAPFGGYKQSGNGREWGKHGLAEYLEVKTIVAPAKA